MRVLLPLLLAWGSCEPMKDTAPQSECEAVTATCPEDGARAYWSTCAGGGWDHVDECFGATCRPAEHGEEPMESDSGATWLDLWAVCSEGYGHLEGVVCCYQ